MMTYGSFDLQAVCNAVGHDRFWYSLYCEPSCIYLAGRKHSEFLELFCPRKRADLRFLLGGPLLLTQARSRRVATPGSGVRVGACCPAGLCLLKPGLSGGLCRRVRHISSLTLPLNTASLPLCDECQ